MAIINFAHRGASGHSPENTMAAFKLAVEMGATGIETDVQMTRDGRLICIHDESLNRTTNRRGFIREIDFSEIREADAGSWLHERFAGELVPTLEELLELSVQHDLTLNIELKNGIYPYPGMEEKVVQQVREFGWTSKTIISSFNHYSLAECAKIAPEIERGVLYSSGIYEPWQYAATIPAGTLHPVLYSCSGAMVRQAHANRCKVNVWTVNDPDALRCFVENEVDGIITDYPDRLRDVLQEG